MVIHDRAYHRSKSWSKALRKYHIDRELSPHCLLPMYDNLHQYADNKIHCSCPMCAVKTNNRGHYGPVMNWRIRDRRQLEEMDYEEDDE